MKISKKIWSFGCDSKSQLLKDIYNGDLNMLNMCTNDEDTMEAECDDCHKCKKGLKKLTVTLEVK